MRKYLFFLSLTLIAVPGFAQVDSIQPPYKKFPFFPPVKLFTADSTGFTKEQLPKKKPVMLMVFSPMCEHCQHETEDLVKSIDKFKNITIVMATMMPFDSMMNFRAKYGLAKYKNIIMGQDIQFFLPPYYDIHTLPFLAFYDKRGKLISVFEGKMPINKVLLELSK
ncbi:MAG: redoxin domain-containing protein [Sphingobacteriales bacterium]|nr:redoxin domain-containing protein [Sphingobacteriales bacterium]